MPLLVPSYAGGPCLVNSFNHQYNSLLNTKLLSNINIAHALRLLVGTLTMADDDFTETPDMESDGYITT